jgi:hypothetical protein
VEADDTDRQQDVQGVRGRSFGEMQKHRAQLRAGEPIADQRRHFRSRGVAEAGLLTAGFASVGAMPSSLSSAVE